MNYDSEIDKQEMLVQSFIHKEFYIFSLPSYFIIIASLIRMYNFHKQDKLDALHQNDEIHGYQWQPELTTKLITSVHKKTISFQLKTYITVWIGFTYLLTFLLSYYQLLVSFQVPQFYSFQYIIMITGQIISYILLTMEFQRNEDQSITSHRIFWPFQASFFFIRVLQQYVSITFGLIDCAQLAPSMILLLYGLYKPNDNDEKLDDTEVPGFAKDLFQFIEHNRIVRRIIPVVLEQTKDIELEPVAIKQFIRSPERENSTLKEFSQILNKNNTARASIYDQENFLLNKLPKRAVLISKKVSKRFQNEKESEVLYFYQIVTQIDQSHYIVERRYPDFLDLEKTQKQLYANVGPEKLPTLDKIDLRLNEEEMQYIQRRAEVLEQWLKDLFKEPIFISNALLQFLGVEDQHQGVFLTYSSLMLQKKEKLIKPTSKIFKAVAKESMLPYQFNRDSFQNCDQLDNYIAQNMSDLNFTSVCNSYEYGMFGANSLEFVVIITYTHQSGKEYQYRILKTLSSIKEFTNTLEIQLGRTLPASMTQSKKSKIPKMQFVDYFFKNLLSNQDYYCSQLFDFINFDVKKKTELQKDTADHTAASP